MKREVKWDPALGWEVEPDAKHVGRILERVNLAHDDAKVALTPGTQYAYCFDREWQPGMPGSAFTPLDPLVVDRWPIRIDPDDRAQISVKDREAATFAQLSEGTRS